MRVMPYNFGRFAAWVSPTLRLPVAARAWPWLMVLGLLFLTACALDRERAVRVQLDKWVVLGEAVFFNSTSYCTAAIYQTRASSVLSGVKKATSVDRGLDLIEQEQAVSLNVQKLTPVEIYEQIDQANRPVSLKMLVSALAAKDCFTQTLQDSYVQALNTQDVVLIYDPQNAAMALFDRAQKQVFYSRAVIR